MQTKKVFLAILVLVVMVAGLAAQDAIQLSENLKTQLMQKLTLSEQQALQIMEQLRTRLQDQKQQRMALDPAAVMQVLNLCKQNRVQTGEVASVLAAGNSYMQRMQQYGEPAKDVRREMCMTMSREMRETRSMSGQGIGDRVAAALKTRLQAQLRQGTGDDQKNANRYRHSYHGERGYSGAQGGKKTSGGGGP